MDPLSTFGLFAAAAMLVCYALEHRSPWLVFAFAASCALEPSIAGAPFFNDPIGAVDSWGRC